MGDFAGQHKNKEGCMDTRRWNRSTTVILFSIFVHGMALVSRPGFAAVNLVEMPKDHNQWVLPGQYFSVHRYSELNQITAANVKNLKVAWTFSTGVLRGHDGTPLVVGDTMYLVAPFPNLVYALDLSKPGAPVKWKYQPKQDEA